MSVRKPISIRLESCIIEWFKAERPKGYQTLINSVLRAYVDQQCMARHHLAGRAQELFKRYYARCFWHYKVDLKITPSNMHLVVDGLRKYGGREGVLLAEQLCH